MPCYAELMTLPDLNLLVTLDALLSEGSVARAARRLRLSPSATSRALARLREVTGDPLLVRAGRGLVPTPRARELAARVGPVLDEATAMLRPLRDLDLGTLERTFTLRCSEGFVETFGPALVGHVAAQAPGVRLSFMTKTDRDSALLREGSVDLETGVVGDAASPSPTSPEIKARALFRDRFVGVVRSGHPLAVRPPSLADYVAARHVGIARRGAERWPVDDALGPLGLQRDVAVRVGGFAAALALAAATDLAATIPERHTGGLRQGLHIFPLPLAVAPITVSLLWHPRMDADPAHRWLRGLVHDICGD